MGHSNYGMAPTKCIPAVIKFVMSRKQNAGRSHFMKTDNRSFERVGEFKCLGTTLTLRRLMSYIYMQHPFLMFLDHTQRRTTVGRTPLDE